MVFPTSWVVPQHANPKMELCCASGCLLSIRHSIQHRDNFQCLFFWVWNTYWPDHFKFYHPCSIHHALVFCSLILFPAVVLALHNKCSAFDCVHLSGRHKLEINVPCLRALPLRVWKMLCSDFWGYTSYFLTLLIILHNIILWKSNKLNLRSLICQINPL